MDLKNRTGLVVTWTSGGKLKRKRLGKAYDKLQDVVRHAFNSSVVDTTVDVADMARGVTLRQYISPTQYRNVTQNL